MNKLFKRIAILLCIIFIAPTILNCLPSVNSVTSVEAAAKKAKLYQKTGTIGIQSSPEYLYVENQKESAKYTYTSSDKKIATVDKYGVVTGISKGSAKITVKEVYKKKTTTVGTYKVTVVNSALALKEDTATLYSKYYAPIKYINHKATYKYDISDTSIVTYNEEGYLIGLKAGTTNIKVSETYKNKKRDLGSFALTVVESTLHPESTAIEVGVNSKNPLYNYIVIENQPWNSEVTYSYESSNTSVVTVTKETSEWFEDLYYIKGIATGTATITVYEEYKGNKRTVGTVAVTVREIPITDLKFNTYFFDTENGTLTTTVYLGEDDELSLLKDYIVKAPENATTDVTFSSSNEAIAKVDNDGKITTVSGGTVTITVKSGNFQDKLQLTVIDLDDDSYDEEDTTYVNDDDEE